MDLQPVEVAATIQAAAAVLTFLAACVAVFATLKAPQRAARLAEDLRVQNEKAEAGHREKYRIFRVLMEHRGRNISALEPVNALNMIDVAFHDDRPVRDAFANLLRFANGPEFAHQRIAAYLDIVVAMAKVLGFSAKVAKTEIDRGYYPAIDA